MSAFILFRRDCHTARFTQQIIQTDLINLNIFTKSPLANRTRVIFPTSHVMTRFFQTGMISREIRITTQLIAPHYIPVMSDNKFNSFFSPLCSILCIEKRIPEGFGNFARRNCSTAKFDARLCGSQLAVHD